MGKKCGVTKIWGKKFGGKIIFWSQKFLKTFFRKKIWGKKFLGKKKFGKKFLGEKKFLGNKFGEKSFIVIGSAVFEKHAINVFVIIIITRSINRHIQSGFSPRHQFFLFWKVTTPPPTDESDEIMLPSREDGLKLSQMWVANF